MTVAERTAVLREHGAGPNEVEELLRYTEPTFDIAGARSRRFPLEDEPFVAAWSDYVAESAQRGVWRCLRDKLVQLRFPIEQGTSRTSAYRAATRRGDLSGAPEPSRGLSLCAPGKLRLRLHWTPAGRIPVLIAEEREDFVALVRALVHQNRPHPISEGQGACIVGGYNNWDRVRRLRDQWRSRHPHDNETAWQSEFRRLIPRRELYQDRFIILGAGPYSGVSGADMGMAESSWSSLSLRIRLEHESAHYFTRRVLGSMSNSLHDELIADYIGLTIATGSFRAAWFLRFMGVQQKGAFRPTGRLRNYRGTPPLSSVAFRVLQRLVRSAAHGIEILDPMADHPRAATDAWADAVLTLANETVESMAVLGLKRSSRHV